MSALFIEKTIALKVMRNADRSPRGVQQDLLTEKLKEKIPVLGNWRWCCTWAANRTLKLNSALTKPTKNCFVNKRTLSLMKVHRYGLRSDLTLISLGFLLFSSVLGLCDIYGCWPPLIRELKGFIVEDKHSWVFSVGAVRLSWQHGDSCGPASVRPPGLLLQGRRFLQG